MSHTSSAPFTTEATFSTGSFSVVNGTDTCSQMLLQPQASCTLQVQFKPLVSELNPSGTTPISGTMILSGVENAPGSTNVLITAKIALSGTGQI